MKAILQHRAAWRSRHRSTCPARRLMHTTPQRCVCAPTHISRVPARLPHPPAPSAGKMVLLDKLLPKLQSRGSRVLIFSQASSGHLQGRGAQVGIDGAMRHSPPSCAWRYCVLCRPSPQAPPRAPHTHDGWVHPEPHQLASRLRSCGPCAHPHSHLPGSLGGLLVPSLTYSRTQPLDGCR